MGRLDGRSAGLGAVAGVLAAGAALGVGQFVAGLTGASGSPVVVVGELQIDFTPPWLKNFAITEFGADDKLVLVTGIVIVLAYVVMMVKANLDEFPVVPAGMAPRPPGTIPPPPGYAPFPPAPGTIPPPPAPTQRPMY